MNRASYASYSSSPHTSPRPSHASPTKIAPSSPPRKVVTDFAAFGAPKSASVFGTAVASTPFSLAGGKAAFGGMRIGGGRSVFDDEEEEDDDRKQKVELREDSISLDQVRIFSSFFELIFMTFALLGETNRHAECVEERKSLNILGSCFSVYFPLIDRHLCNLRHSPTNPTR